MRPTLQKRGTVTGVSVAAGILLSFLVTEAGAEGVEVKDMDDSSGRPAVLRNQAELNKQELTSAIVRIKPKGGTPLRLGLENVGKYFEGYENFRANVGGSVLTGNDYLFGFAPIEGRLGANGGNHTPILSEADRGDCQQNYAVVISDGYWNGDDPGVGNADSGSGPFDGGSFQDSISNTLADVAMHYYERDLDTLLPNNVRLTDSVSKVGWAVDGNGAQHLVTFAVAFGVDGTLSEAMASPPANWDDVNGHPTDEGTSFAWPDPHGGNPQRIDDMRHAAWNGRGLFESAEDPHELKAALEKVVGSTTVDSGSTSSVGVSGSTLAGGGYAYQGSYDSNYWSGDVKAFDTSTTPSWTEVWSAADRIPDPGSRVMITYNGVSGLAFEAPADYTAVADPPSGTLSRDQIRDLLYDGPEGSLGPPYDAGTPVTSANQTYLEEIVSYLRGDNSGSGIYNGGFRNRGGMRLGDIVNSGVVYVGKPNPMAYPNYIESSDDPYVTHANSTAMTGRAPMLYVGANDGGLHAFDTNGNEKLVYIPKAVFSDQLNEGLRYLAHPDYAHRYYVDATPAIAEAYTNFKIAPGYRWGTVLVGGLGAGGRSYFALDVTDPSQFSESNANDLLLWEYPDPVAHATDYADMGATFSEPSIVKMANDKWAAVVGNGYNSDNGVAKLFIIYLDGSTPKILSTGKGSNSSSVAVDCPEVASISSDCFNGLSTPLVADFNKDAVADRIYAGDLWGNMWVFDVSSDNPDHWDLDFGGAPLYTARDVSNNRQPITARPLLGKHPYKHSSAADPNVIVLFGTGQLLAPADVNNVKGQSFYAVLDDGSNGGMTRDLLLENTPLQKQTITVNGAGDARTITNDDVNWATQWGWYVDLPGSGERVIYRPALWGDLVVFVSIVPTPLASCGADGESWIMALDYVNGTAADFIALDLDKSGTFDASDQVGGENAAGLKRDDISGGPVIVHDAGGGRIIVSGGLDSEAPWSLRVSQSFVPSRRSSWIRLDL